MSAPVAPVSVSDDVQCPAWCIGRNDTEDEHVHSGAYTDVTASIGCWVWQDAEKLGIYVADGNMTPGEARHLIAGLQRAVTLAEQVDSTAGRT